MTFVRLMLVMGVVIAAAARAQEGRPNFVIVLADDMGFSDAGCFGGEIATPNIDRLAAGGMRFSQFYNASRCCPTRASLMTGMYPHKVGLARNGQSLAANAVTIAEALKGAGYATAMAGKWHLSFTPQLRDGRLHQQWVDHQHDPGMPFGPLETYPVRRGFDRHYGIIWGVINYFDPFSLVDGIEPVREVPKDYYITDAISEKAVEYVKDLSAGGKPFLLYVAHCAPHWPLHAREAEIAKYAETYRGGWDEVRKARYERQIAAGLFDRKSAPLPAITGGGKAWGEMSDVERSRLAKRMAVHAAMVDRMDQGIGKLIGALEEAGKLRDTVIFFLSDNGASNEVPNQPGYDRSAQTRDGREIRYNDMDLVGAETSYTGIGPRWASAANTPFRYWKIESFEGGNHTPLVVHWPAGLKAEAGSIVREVGHVIDLMPTCLELAGVKHGAMNGKSLVPVLLNEKREGHEALYFEHEGGRAIRAGDWKLVAARNASAKWELYDLASDWTETKDLAAEHPEHVRGLSERWEKWAAEAGVPRGR